MVLIGLSALYFTAKRVKTAVEEVPQEAEQVAVDNPIPVPVTAGETAAQAAGIPEPTAVVEPKAESQPLQSAAPDNGLQKKIAVFADGRRAVWEVLEKYPKTRESVLKELTDTVDTEKVQMYNYEMVEIRIARSRPLRDAGMEEDEYRLIRTQYRAYRSGEGDLDPAYKAAFDSAPEEVMARADLKEFELLDY
jgi:hypothetical protein